jgi:hypothetical protein
MEVDGCFRSGGTFFQTLIAHVNVDAGAVGYFYRPARRQLFEDLPSFLILLPVEIADCVLKAFNRRQKLSVACLLSGVIIPVNTSDPDSAGSGGTVLLAADSGSPSKLAS